MRASSFSFAVASAVVGLTLIAIEPSSAAIINPFRTVARFEQSAPGQASSVLFNSFYAPTINSAGQVAVTAFLKGAGVTTSNDQGIWFERDGALRFVTREFFLAPIPISNARYTGFEQPFALDDGQIAFRGYTNLSVPSPFTITSALATYPTGQALRTVSGHGFPVPDANGNPTPGYAWSTLTVSAAHSNEMVLLYGIIRHTSGTYQGGFWLRKDGITRLMARDDQQAPGALPGIGYQMFGEPVMNRFGEFAFQASLFEPGFGDGHSSGIWTNRNGSLELLFRAGAPAPEFGPGVFGGPNRHNLGINDDGHVAFLMSLDGTGVSDSNDQAIVLDEGALRRVIVREGQSAPGGLPGQVFDRFELGKHVVNDKGQVAFSAFARGPGINTDSRNGIWLETSPGQLIAIVRGEAAAPGGGFFRIDRQQAFALNDFGQVAFRSELLDDGGEGIWATDREGTLQLVVRTGSQIEVTPGSFRTVTTVNYLHDDFDDDSTGMQDGLKSAFNNRGEIAFAASFSDGTSGVFVSSAVAVPEPAAIVLCIFATVLLGHRSLVHCNRVA